jgi:hypothetical protein
MRITKVRVGMLSFMAACLSACTAQRPTHPQEAPHSPTMEVLAGPGRPSSLLAEHLDKNAEAFVVVDIGLWVQELVGSALGGSWDNLEHDRFGHLRSVLGRMVEALPPPRTAEDVVAGVAHVAAALLHNDAVDALTLVPPWRAEITAVVNGERAPRAWRRDAAAFDWSGALPNGAYVGRFASLFRATWYLRASLAQLDVEQHAAWDRAVAAAIPDDPSAMGNRAAIARTDAALCAFLGTVPGPMPAVLGDLPPLRASDRAILRSASGGEWWDRLAAVHAEGPGEGEDLRTASFRVAHALATEALGDAWLATYGHERWRHKWLDLADYTYVGVREVDCLAGGAGHRSGSATEVVRCAARGIRRPRRSAARDRL